MDSTALGDKGRSALHTALGVGVAYLVFGSLWIWYSDGLVAAVSRDPDWLVTAQRYKGLVYIGVTAGCLVCLVQLGCGRLLVTSSSP